MTSDSGAAMTTSGSFDDHGALLANIGGFCSAAALRPSAGHPACPSPHCVASSLRSILPLGLRGSGPRLGLGATRHHVGGHLLAALCEQSLHVQRVQRVQRVRAVRDRCDNLYPSDKCSLF